jgi:hypothetical protein
MATDKFLKTIRYSYTSVSRVVVKGPNQEPAVLEAISGDVSVDRTASIRRSCTITCVDSEGTLTPRGPESLLTPFGTELRPYRGVVYDDDTEELQPLGVFRLAKADVSDKVGSTEIKLEAYDLSRTVKRDRFTSPYVIASTTNVIQAIKDILARTFPDLEYDAVSTSLTTTAPKVYDVGDDPWDAATELATSLGCELYFDVLGRVVIAPPTDVDALPAPVFDYIEGPTCTMTDLSLAYSDEPGFNGVIVIGESLGDEQAPVRGEAWDDEPTSATYRYGPYGEVPYIHTDQVIKTAADAQAAATQMLKGLLGFSSSLSIQAMVNPALEAGDVVEVRRERSHVDDVFIVDAFNIPMSKDGTQTLQLRQRRSSG